MRLSLHSIALIVFVSVLGCGSDDGSPRSIPSKPLLRVSPLEAAIPPLATLQLAAVAVGVDKPIIRWTVVDGPQAGTVSADGLFQATENEGTFHVRASLDEHVFEEVVITVTRNVEKAAVEILPAQVTVGAGETVQFTARTLGSFNSAVAWSTSGGTITETGRLSTPLTAGQVVVTAKSLAHPDKSATATVTVEPQIASVALALVPLAAEIVTGATLQFVASVGGTVDDRLAWSIADAGGGTVDTSGKYTAPSAPGVYQVTVMSLAAPAVTQTATVTVVPRPLDAVSLAIAPTALTLQAGQSFDFEAAVTGTADPGVDWSVVEVSGGQITADGLYAAPATAGTYHVKAESRANPSVWATATVTVSPYETTVAIALSPLDVSLRTGAAFTFEAAVAGSANTSVIWRVDEGAVGGSIDAAGNYTAPGAPGTFHVRAVAEADLTVEAVATVTVTAPDISVTITPTVVTLDAEATQQFTAEVVGASGGVYWSINAADGGVVTSAGHYTAPYTGGTYYVRAVSKDDPLAIDEATVTVLTPVEVGVSPSSATVVTNSTLVFAAFVTGAASADVAWSVVEQHGGLIDAAGSYQAPATVGTYHVRATSLDEPSAFHEATVRVVPDGVWLEVTAPTKKVMFGGTALFEAQVFAASDTSVTWSLPEADTGRIEQDGLYTAPATGGAYRVRATSVEAPTSFAEATVTVQGPWLRTLDLGSTSSGLSAVKRHADGSLWAVGWKRVTTPYETLYYGWVAQFAADGKTIIREALLTYVRMLGDLAFMANGNLLVVGTSNVWTTGYYDGVAIALTPDLSPVWAKSYGVSTRNDYFQFAHTADGETFFVGGQSSPATIAGDYTALLHIDATGAIQSQRIFNQAPGRLVARPDGSFFLIASYSGGQSIKVRKFSPTGAFQWGKSLTDFRVHGAAPGAWGGIVISGQNFDMSQSGAFEIDGNGNVVWGTGLGTGSYTRIHAGDDAYTLIDKRSYVYSNVLWFAGFTTTGTVTRQGELAGSSAYWPTQVIDNGRRGFVIASEGQGQYPFFFDLTTAIAPGLPPASGFMYYPTYVTPMPWTIVFTADNASSSLSWAATERTPVTAETVTPVTTVFE